MRSYLTRGIFRAILANESYTFSGCPKAKAPWQTFQLRSSLRGRPHYRSIFGLTFGASPRTLSDTKNTPANVEKAVILLVDFVQAQRKQTRLPSEREIAESFHFLFQSRLKDPTQFSTNEIFLATEAFQYLKRKRTETAEDGKEYLANEDLENALFALEQGTGSERFRSDSKALALMIFQELRQRSAQSGEELMKKGDRKNADLMRTYISILSSTGGAKEARDFLRQSSDEGTENMSEWITVVKGLANEGLENEALETIEEMQGLIGLLDLAGHEELTIFFAAKDNVRTTKKLFETEIEANDVPSLNCRLAVVNFCIRNNQMGWGAPTFDSILTESDTPRILDTVLLWSAAQATGAKDIERMVERLRDTNEFTHRGPLNISNINSLLKYAYSVNDMNAVEAYLGLARNHNIRLNAYTYMLRMEHQLIIKDLAGAVSSFDLLSSEDSLTDDSDVPLLNRLLTAISFSPNPDYELVMRVLDSLLDRGADLEAETVSALCHFFLHRDEYEEAMGLLRHRVDSYPTNDRARISQVFREFILDTKIKDQRAFNAYELFRHAFPETSVDLRLPIMHSFFDRRRPDLACLVFGHMRQREDIESRPTAEAYAQCFEGIAKCKDVDGLQMVYNMLKLDLEVEQTTRIHNGLMSAYTACAMPFTAIIDHFWKIMDSREGPSLSSFALALRACETWVPQGAQEARRIIAMMQGWNLVITKEIYLCYIGALAGQSEFENTIELIEEMEKDVGCKPDAYTVGTFYNAIPWQYRKDEVEAWAKQAYPELWEELLSYGDEIDEEWEVRYFKIDRSIDLDDEPLFSHGEYDPRLAHESQILLEAPYASV